MLPHDTGPWPPEVPPFRPPVPPTPTPIPPAQPELGASLTLADAVDLVRPPVKALVRGVLRGPAAAVLCACEHRAAHHNALFVLSLPVTAMTASSSADVVHLTQQLELQEAQLRRRLVATTGRTDEEVAEDLRSGRFLTADEAKDYGLLHEVV